MRNSSKKGSISSMGLKNKTFIRLAVSSGTGDGDGNGGGGAGAMVVSVTVVQSSEGRQMEARGCGSRTKKKVGRVYNASCFLRLCLVEGILEGRGGKGKK